MGNRHTPGPWAVVDGYIYRGDPIEGKMIAQVRGWGWLQYTKDGAEVQDANGRLIAAAPDLLEVCQSMLEAVPYVSDYDVPIGLWDDLRYAIAKATGDTE